LPSSGWSLALGFAFVVVVVVAAAAVVYFLLTTTVLKAVALPQPPWPPPRPDFLTFFFTRSAFVNRERSQPRTMDRNGTGTIDFADFRRIAKEKV